MTVFDLYAAYYDLLNGDKDYSAEADYVATLLTEVAPAVGSVLDLGCGTGGHAVRFVEQGLAVHGVDLSLHMVERANARRLSLAGSAEQLSFERADIRTFRASRSFDAVVSLFHVMSYQTRNEDMLDAMGTARCHLKPGGVFLFDCWYGPAVLSDRPRNVAKKVADDRIEVTRLAHPTMHFNENCVNVRFDIEISTRDAASRQVVVENHRMRYFFLPEVEHFLSSRGFRLHSAQAWMSRKALDDCTWYACFVAQAV